MVRRPHPERVRRSDADLTRGRAAGHADRRARASRGSPGGCSATSRGSTALRTAPGWKPEFFINECPPLSALVVDRAVYDRHVALRPALAAAGSLPPAPALARGHERPGRARPRTRRERLGLAQVESQPLPAILQEMDRESDNFTAEVVLKELGAEVGAAGIDRRRRGRRASRSGRGGHPARRRAHRRRLRALARRQADRARPREPARLGLGRPVAAAALLGRARGRRRERHARAPDAAACLRAATCAPRRARPTSRRRFRATPATRFAFSVLQNGQPIAAHAAQRAQDRFATALASSL